MSQPPQHSPRMEALVAAGIALAAVGGAGFLGWYIGWPGNFDTSDPDFLNPLSAIILGLIGAAGWFGVKALGHERRHRAFGTVVLDLDPPGYLRLGGPFAGRLKAQKPVAATGPFHLVLTCYDVQQFEDNDRLKTVDFPVWTDGRMLPPETDALAGLAFRFVLPASVGLDPVPSGILPGSGSRNIQTVHVSGMKRVIAGNTPPLARYWKLAVTAPTSGPEFRAEVVVPLEPPRRKGRLP